MVPAFAAASLLPHSKHPHARRIKCDDAAVHSLMGWGGRNSNVCVFLEKLRVGAEHLRMRGGSVVDRRAVPAV